MAREAQAHPNEHVWRPVCGCAVEHGPSEFRRTALHKARDTAHATGQQHTVQQRPAQIDGQTRRTAPHTVRHTVFVWITPLPEQLAHALAERARDVHGAGGRRVCPVVGVIAVGGGRDERLRLNRFDDVRRAQSRRIVLSEEVL